MNNLLRMTRRYGYIGVIVLLGLGVIARILVANYGYTYDMESYELAAKSVLSGKTVYAETVRYNYGPFWFYMLGGAYHIASFTSYPFIVFRYLIVGLLSIVDIGIFFLLSRIFRPRAAWLYYLNPISIVVTGYYSQFDNIALLIGLFSVYIYNHAQDYKKNHLKYAAFAILGISLVVKHIFFAFPFWLAVREKKWRDRLLALVIPVGIFFISFLPFVTNGFHDIIQNVFLYVSFHNAPLYHLLVPDYFQRYIRPEVFFAAALFAGAFWTRKKPIYESLLWYALVLVLFSIAASEQYFVIMLPFLAVYPNVFFALFVVVETVFMGMMMDGGEILLPIVSMRVDRSMFGFSWQMGFLFAGLLYALFWKKIVLVTLRQWIWICICCLLSLVLFVWIPSQREDAVIAPIEQAIRLGEYEKANVLYNETQIDPPFAGSRYWNKLAWSRYNIEYYRMFRKSMDMSEAKKLDPADIQVVCIFFKNHPAPAAFTFDKELSSARNYLCGN